ncbi:MAG: hypothetical protein JXA10_17600 [Anaerolineae bacterium]|nr:hypothetical protein [Anaerolineae bacterium]
MAVQLNIPYETLIELIQQLSAEQRRDLLSHLLRTTQTRQLSGEEKRALFHASILDVPVNEEPSIRREDWYDDDDR